MMGNVGPRLSIDDAIITSEQFLNLLASVVAIWETKASESSSNLERQTFAKGYHTGQAEAFRDVSLFLQSFQWCEHVTQQQMPVEASSACEAE